jgi:hypothetical protein
MGKNKFTKYTSKDFYGMKWFTIESYRFINPKGFKMHVLFYLYFPLAFVKYGYFLYFKNNGKIFMLICKLYKVFKLGKMYLLQICIKYSVICIFK